MRVDEELRRTRDVSSARPLRRLVGSDFMRAVSGVASDVQRVDRCGEVVQCQKDEQLPVEGRRSRGVIRAL